MDSEIDLATVLQAGLTPDVMLLQRLGKALPLALQPQYREAMLILQVSRGLTRAPTPTAARVALSHRLDAVARGTAAPALPGEWEGVVESFRAQGPLAADLLQAAQRELGMVGMQQTVLFPAWSDFYNHARFAVVPVGRALLQAARMSERPDAIDAVMTALALTAALQEAGPRFRRHGALGIPLQWLTAEGLSASALAHTHSPKAIGSSIGRGVARARELLSVAESVPIPPALMTYASAAIFLMRRLLRRIERSAPGARPIRLGLLDRALLRLKHGI